MTRTWTLPIHIVSFWTVRMRKSLRKTVAGGKSLRVTPGICACCRGECLRSQDHVVVWILEAGVISGPNHDQIRISSELELSEFLHRSKTRVFCRKLRNPIPNS